MTVLQGQAKESGNRRFETMQLRGGILAGIEQVQDGMVAIEVGGQCAG
jgi:hypothetical protein